MSDIEDFLTFIDRKMPFHAIKRNRELLLYDRRNCPSVDELRVMLENEGFKLELDYRLGVIAVLGKSNLSLANIFYTEAAVAVYPKLQSR